jgi:hypothetical protein
MRGLFRTLGVRHLGAAAGAILATLLAAPGGASAQCGGWVHDLGSYGPEFLRFFGPRVIDRDGSDGAQIPRIVGHTLDRIVMKSDEDWSFLTGRLHGYPFALEAWDADGPGPMTPRLYFGGTTTSSGAPIYLDSVPWPQSGSTGSHPLAPLPGPVYDMRLTDPDGAGPERPRPIVVCAGTPSRGTIVVLEWSGSAWIQRGSTLVGDWAYVRTAPSGSGSGDSWVLFGDVSRTGFPLVDGILTFDGAEWVSIGAGLQGGDIEGVAWWDHDAASSTPRRLVACGSFSKSGTATVKRVAVFDGSTWISIGDGLGGAAASIATYEHAATGREELLICVSGSPGIPPRFRAYDGVGWRNTGDVGDFYPPHAALQTWDPDGPLSNPPAALALLTGWDTQERAEPGLFIWNGLEWRVVAQPPRTWDSVQAPWDRDGDGPARPAIAHVRVHEFDPYATRDVVLWDGISWETQQTGLAAEYINAVTSWDPDGSGPKESLLVLGGVFTVPRAGEPDITNVVAWDGTSLVPLGEGLRIGGSWPGVRELATWDADGTGPALEELIAFGSIRGSGAESFGAIARFDGERWLPLGSGVWPKYGTSPDCIGAVAEWDPDLDGPLPAALRVGPRSGSRRGTVKCSVRSTTRRRETIWTSGTSHRLSIHAAVLQRWRCKWVTHAPLSSKIMTIARGPVLRR